MSGYKTEQELLDEARKKIKDLQLQVEAKDTLLRVKEAHIMRLEKELAEAKK